MCDFKYLEVKGMRIGELAKAVGLRASAIRYYEKVGVLEPARRVSGRREYGDGALNALRLVQASQRAGFTLEEIRRLMATLTDPPGSSVWPVLAHAKIEELDRAVRRLRKARAVLLDSLDCACAGRADSCKLVARTRTKP